MQKLCVENGADVVVFWIDYKLQCLSLVIMISLFRVTRGTEQNTRTRNERRQSKSKFPTNKNN